MAKSVADFIRFHVGLQGARQRVMETSAVGRRVRGFTKTYSQEEIDHIEAERSAMRERLLAEG